MDKREEEEIQQFIHKNKNKINKEECNYVQETLLQLIYDVLF